MDAIEHAIAEDAYDAQTREMEEHQLQRREVMLTPAQPKDEEGVIVNVVSAQMHQQLAEYEQQIKAWEVKYENQRQVASPRPSLPP